MEKILELNFKTENGKKTLTIAKPKESLDLATVAAAQEAIVEANVFTTANGDIVEANGARYVVRDVEELV